ncbi:MAG: tail fiber domain-containing protein [Bacteroidales bacterium]|nr:tail fiber domain-containing protein [Bacteroidales bacterium]
MNRKKILILIFVIGIFSLNSVSQNIAITDDDGYTAESSAMLDVKSLTKGMLVPRLSTAQREAISSPATGLLVFDSDVFSFFYYNGSTWVNLVSLGDYSGGINTSLFSVINSTGDTIFAVYPEGVRIWVDDTPSKATGSKGGFAVGGLNAGKGYTNEYFRITPDSIRIYIDTTQSTKATGSKGGFAVGGFNAGKTNGQEFLRVTDDSVRIYMKNNPSKATGSKGGFAVGGFNAGKTIPVGFMQLTPENYFIGHQSGVNITIGLHNQTMGYTAGINLTEGNRNVFLGYESGYSIEEEEDNVFIGYKSGYNTQYDFVGGDKNVFIGSESGFTNTAGMDNTFLGTQSGYSNIDGDYNVFIGQEAGYSNTTGNSNVYIGEHAGRENTSAGANVFLGYRTAKLSTNAAKCVYIGYGAGLAFYNGTGNCVTGFMAGSQGDGDYNSYYGYESGRNQEGGDYNVCFGYNAGKGVINNGYNYNTFVGSYTGEDNSTGYNNTFLGYKSGSNVTNGYSNTFLGYNSGLNLTTGDNNTFLGTYAGGNSMQTGNRNVFIGYAAGYSESGSDKLYIENSTAGYTSALIYGDFSANTLRFNADVGIGKSPTYKLDVQDNVSGNKVAYFFNDGNHYDRHGIGIQCGSDLLSGDHWFIRCYDGNGTYEGSIKANNGIMSFHDASDKRLKKNISTANIDALKIINSLRVVDYQFINSENNEFNTGYIAQEALEVFPKMVSVDPETGFYGVSPNLLIPILNKAMQQQQDIIEKLHEKNTDLEKRLEILENVLLNK